MKLNKKGFTLTELLATIGILVIMSLLIGVNLNSILKSTQKKNDDEEKIRIQKAACVYVDSTMIAKYINDSHWSTLSKYFKVL